MPDTAFWKIKPLSQMTSQEWESLCDGCGKCCVLKLEDVDSGLIHYTDVGCRLLDCSSARCRDYENRRQQVADCVMLTPDNLHQLGWMPASCAYRLIHEGRDLPDWHPLITGDPDSTRKAGKSVAGRLFSEDKVDEEALGNHLTDWDQL